jgi:hypothetical protein
MATLNGSSVSVRSSPEAVSTRTPRLNQGDDACLLHDELTSDARGILHDDRFDGVAVDPIQECREARTRLDRVRAAHVGIVELLHDLVAGA